MNKNTDVLRSGFAGLLLLFSPTVFLASAVTTNTAAAALEPVVVERGEHHRIWRRVTAYTNANGRIHFRTNSYTELASGMHFRRADGSLAESKELIMPVGGGAIAQSGQHKVFFAANINSPGAITVTAQDGKVYRSHVLGLAYTDARTGKSVLIAGVKDSVGQLIAPNQVLYQDALDSCLADIRYTYTRSGFEQDIVLRRQDIPSPADFGFDPDFTRLEIFTEFVQWFNPRIESQILTRETDAGLRQNMVDPDLTDQTLDFGGISIRQGTAFVLQDQGDFFQDGLAPIGKTWVNLEGRQFLIEKVDLKAIKTQIERLPGVAVLRKGNRHGVKADREALLASLEPPSDKAPDDGQIQMAAAGPAASGLVLDYQAINASSLTNYTFKGDTTYLISGTINLYGTTTIEGGTVVKYTNGNSAQIVLQGPVDCRTTPYNPAIFTARDDCTVGETLPGASTVPPANTYYANIALKINTNNTVFDLHDIVIKYATQAIQGSGGGTSTVLLRNAQVINCNRAFGNYAVTLKMRNVLLNNVLIGYYTTVTNTGEQVTLHKVGTLLSGASPPPAFTNCLVISVTNAVSYTGINVASNLDDTGIFQKVGAGNHYLPEASPYRGIGTTNTDAGLFSTLRQRSTYPPGILTNTVTASMMLTPIVPRGPTNAASAPDLGYYYPAVDYAISAFAITNSTLTIAPGTVLMDFGTVGLWLQDSSVVVCEGTPVQKVQFARYTSIQEQTLQWGATGTKIHVYGYHYGSSAPSARFRFTDFSSPGPADYHIYISGGNWSINPLSLQDCALYGGSLPWNANSEASIAITNNLFERVNASFIGWPSLTAYNNLFRGAEVYFECYRDGAWTFRDNTFVETAITDWGDYPPTHDHNAYIATVNQLYPTNASDIVLSNFTFQSGPLGRYYQQSTNLIDAGSRYATNAGLFHFTTTTNQAPEAIGLADIGLHYACTGTNGLPVDTDRDGLFDYHEDANGNGVRDSNETDFANSDTDYDGRTDGQEIIDRTDPLDSSSVASSLLAVWTFDSANFVGVQGQLTKTCTNVQWVDFTTNLVLQVATNVFAKISYNDVEANGLPNINCQNGTIRFWFKPNWSSTSLGGTGPGWFGRLIELGAQSIDANYGQWVICLNPGGTEISFCTQGDGAAMTNANASVSWNSGVWHQIAITYSRTNSRIYIDGITVGEGAGVQHFPGIAVRQADGVMIGSSKDGTQQALGQYDNLETYNYPLAAADVAADFAQTVGGPGPCVYTPWTGSSPYFTLGPSGSPEPGAFGELLNRRVTAAPTPGLLSRTVYCSGRSEVQQVAWPATLQRLSWNCSADASLPASGIVPLEGPSLTASFAALKSGTIAFTGAAVTGEPKPGLGANVFGTSYPFKVFPDARIGYWRFNGNWVSEEGHNPSSANNVTRVPSWSGSALLVDNASAASIIYPAFNPSGTPIVKRNMGTIRFWFKPNWSSTTAGGSGPGTAARLIEMQSLNSKWSLRLNSTGTAIELYTSDGPANFSRTINPPWAAGQWHQITVTYRAYNWSYTLPSGPLNVVPDATDLYIDGLLNRSGTPLDAAGAANVEAANAVLSFSIGSDSSGNLQAKGAFDELETFNYPLDGTAIQSAYYAVAQKDSDGDQLTDLQEVSLGSDPNDADTDGDGVPDGADAFPLDPTRSDPVPPSNPNDTVPPVIQLLNPPNAH